jgi:hypothetical protein
MNHAMELDVRRVAEKPNQRIVDIAVIVRAFTILATIGLPAEHLIFPDVVALNEVITV